MKMFIGCTAIQVYDRSRRLKAVNAARVGNRKVAALSGEFRYALIPVGGTMIFKTIAARIPAPGPFVLG
jgi:hypothetical protein